MFDLVRTVNTAIDHKAIGEADARVVGNAFAHFDRVLGVLSLRRAEDEQPPIPLAEIAAAVDARQAARRARNFAEADRLRDARTDRRARNGSASEPIRAPADRRPRGARAQASRANRPIIEA